MDNETDYKKALKRRERWLDRLRSQYAELNDEHNALKEQLATVISERDSALGDVIKLKALVAELEAKVPKSQQIIIP